MKKLLWRNYCEVPTKGTKPCP